MKCVILAAGIGSRLYPFTAEIPKPMLPILNRPVLEHLLFKVRETGIREVLINLHYLPEKLMDYFGDGSKFGVKIVWRVEKKLSGPAGALIPFEDLLQNDEAVLVLSGDGIHDINLKGLIQAHLEKKAPFTVAMKEVQDPGRYGVMKVNELGLIIDFVEKPPLPSDAIGLVSCGIYCLNPRLLREFPHHGLYDYGDQIRRMVADGRAVYGFLSRAYWSDIGTPATLLETNLDALRGKVHVMKTGKRLEREIFLDKNVSIASDVILEGPVLIGEGACVLAGAQIVGPVVIGAGCTISENAYVREAVLFPGSVVQSSAVVIGRLYKTR